MRYHQCILFTVLMFSGPDKIGASQTTEQQSLEKSVVLIRSIKQDFDYVTPWKQKAMRQSIGSGFLIAVPKGTPFGVCDAPILSGPENIKTVNNIHW